MMKIISHYNLQYNSYMIKIITALSNYLIHLTMLKRFLTRDRFRGKIIPDIDRGN